MIASLARIDDRRIFRNTPRPETLGNNMIVGDLTDIATIGAYTLAGVGSGISHP
jgi:hypothetical protein